MATSDDIYQLIAQEIPRLRRYARFLARNADQADDLVQECLTRAVSNIDRWQPGTNMNAWLLVILHNIFINEVKRRRPMLTSDGAIEQHGGGTSGGQEERIYLNNVQQAFDKLSTDHKEILLMIAVEGLQYEEAAAILNVPIGTVRSRISRARESLRELLAGRAEMPARPAAGKLASK
ncbi:MAG: sigma-70 family RNA polymerase sigma factor [Dongiaceae bacterium]